MFPLLDQTLTRFLRWTEKYTKTDMVYLAKVALWTNIDTVTVSVLALLLSIAFANLLPSDVYGVYQYFLSLSALLTAITLAGMNRAVSQSVARGFEGDLRSSVRIQLLWNIIPTAIGLVGALYYLAHGNSELGIGLIVMALLAPITNVFNTYNAFLQGKKEFKRIFLYNAVTYAAYYSSMFIAVFFFKNAIALILVNLASNAAAIIYLYFRTLKVYKPNDRTDVHTVPYGIHLSIMNAFGTTITQIDSILVFHFLGPVQLAIYSFATMLPERIGGLLGFIATAAFPKFANQSRAQVQQHIISKMFRSLGAGAALALLYVVLAPFLFHFLFPRYESAIFYTQIYAVVIVMMATTFLVGSALAAQRMKFELYITSFVNPLTLLFLQVPLLLLYGIMGMLVAKIISDAINILVGVVLLLKARSDQ